MILPKVVREDLVELKLAAERLAMVANLRDDGLGSALGDLARAIEKLLRRL